MYTAYARPTADLGRWPGNDAYFAFFRYSQLSQTEQINRSFVTGRQA